MRRDIPNLAVELPPLTYAAQARAALAEAEAITHADALVDELIEDADHRYQLREARKERRWSPPFRCDKCHAYTSSANSGCKRCGHPYASNDEGQRTSYARAHARRQRRTGGQR
jgi:hypothetical protein